MATLREHTLKIAVTELIHQGFNQSKTAQALGISRGCLRMMLVEAAGTKKGINKVLSQKHHHGIVE